MVIKKYKSTSNVLSTLPIEVLSKARRMPRLRKATRTSTVIFGMDTASKNMFGRTITVAIAAPRGKNWPNRTVNFFMLQY